MKLNLFQKTLIYTWITMIGVAVLIHACVYVGLPMVYYQRK